MEATDSDDGVVSTVSEDVLSRSVFKDDLTGNSHPARKLFVLVNNPFIFVKT